MRFADLIPLSKVSPRALAVVGKCLALAAALSFGGCETSARRMADNPTTPGYVPSNVSRLEGDMPADIRRVVLMPMTRDQVSEEMIDGGEVFESALGSQLMAERQLEAVRIHPDTVRRLLGKHHYRVDEPLPPSFLATLRRDPGVDAALFIHLKGYRAYPPLLVAASLRLVSLKDGAVIWASDESFDASNPAVTAGARRYRLSHQAWLSTPQLEDSKAALQSPRLFCDYAAQALVKTMPPRKTKPVEPQVSAKTTDKKDVRIGK